MKKILYGSLVLALASCSPVHEEKMVVGDSKLNSMIAYDMVLTDIVKKSLGSNAFVGVDSVDFRDYVQVLANAGYTNEARAIDLLNRLSEK